MITVSSEVLNLELVQHQKDKQFLGVLTFTGSDDCCSNRNECFEALVCLAETQRYPSDPLQLAEVVFYQFLPFVGILVERRGTFRSDFGGIFRLMSRSTRSFRNHPVSNTLSANKCSANRSRDNVTVSRKSGACLDMRKNQRVCRERLPEPVSSSLCR